MAEPAGTGTGPILVVIGTRPEAVKLAPVIAALERRGAPVTICHTGQHRELLDETLAVFGITPHHWLDVMVANQSLLELNSRLFAGFDRIFKELAPRAVVVQGDTATVAVAAWASFLSRIDVAHVEAGLRSGNRMHPFPEEINRRIAGLTASWHLAPTALAAANLLKEGTPPESVVVTGNTVVDSLLWLRERLASAELPLGLDPARPILLVTAHRRENHGPPLESICRALRRIAVARPELQLVIPVHPNPAVGAVMERMLGSVQNCLRTAPLNYRDFVTVMMHAEVALSDSGGVQEEGPCLGLPVLVMREVTERPEGIEVGSVRLIGTDEERIVSEVMELLNHGDRYRQMAVPRMVYGDGLASERIADILLTGKLRREPFVAGGVLVAQ